MLVRGHRGPRSSSPREATRRLSRCHRVSPGYCASLVPRPRRTWNRCEPPLTDYLECGFIVGSIEHKGSEPAQVPVTVAGAEVVPANRRIGEFDSDGERPAPPFAAGAAQEDGVTVLEPGRDRVTEEVSPIGADEVLREIDRIAVAPPELLDYARKLLAETRGGG